MVGGLEKRGGSGEGIGEGRRATNAFGGLGTRSTLSMVRISSLWLASQNSRGESPGTLGPLMELRLSTSTAAAAGAKAADKMARAVESLIVTRSCCR